MEPCNGQLARHCRPWLKQELLLGLRGTETHWSESQDAWHAGKVVLTSNRVEAEDQEFKVVLGYLVSLRPTRGT